MKRYIKKALQKLLHPIVIRLGYHPADNEQNSTIVKNKNFLGGFFSLLIEINFIPKHIVDVGANHGVWTREALHYFPDAQFTLLEPQGWLKESISDLLEANKKINFYPVGAGASNGNQKFTLADRDDSSSFHISVMEAEDRGLKQTDVEVVALNHFLPTVNNIIPDLIKIDAEGIDLEVLQGANHYFGKTEIFMVEAGVVNRLFDNNILNVITFMDQHGYRLFDITDLNRPFDVKVLWLIEMVFIKKEGAIDTMSFIK